MKTNICGQVVVAGNKLIWVNIWLSIFVRTYGWRVPIKPVGTAPGGLRDAGHSMEIIFSRESGDYDSDGLRQAMRRKRWKQATAARVVQGNTKNMKICSYVL